MFKKLFSIKDEQDWDEMEKAITPKKLIGEDSDKKRISRRKRSKGTDDLIDDEGIHKFFIKSIPTNRLPPQHCSGHHVLVVNNRLELHCVTRVSKDRYWVFALENKFRDGTLRFNLDEKEFHFLMVNLKPGIFIVRNKRTIFVNQKNELPITKYKLEGSV